MRKFVKGFAVAATATAAVLAQGGTATAATTWTANPACSTVVGPGGITYTNNDGATLTATNKTTTPITYTHGLAALDTANTLVAVQEVTDTVTYNTTRRVYRSTNAGCNWTQIGSLNSGWVIKATAAKGGRAYLWSDSGESGIFRLTGTTIVKVTDPTPSGITGLNVDPANGLHLVIGDYNGQLHESADGGVTWTAKGTTPGSGLWAYDVAIDPANLNHAIVGTMSNGAFVTFNGGQTWTAATGLDLTPAGPLGVNAFSAAVSPVDSNVVYVQGLDTDQSDAGHPSQGRHVYRSTDGGLTFTAVIDQNADVTLVNGPSLYPSPVNAAELYFEFGSNFQGWGTDLYKYSAATGQVTKQHNNEHEITAIAFNPAFPSTLYLGLAKEPSHG
ncbi:WD40/YVTN/BNR-like repeat-containing protein [Longispora albida]|uniref:WD40/YVTN/BNR-like repeat-containing protein n=1 Tax=Longispora albida TaxID=203523 RepID=UPI00037382F2|nr:hypothetical protein [Longispora albida]